MLALRLIRGSRPKALFRRLLLAAAAGCVGFLLLAALSHALQYPDRAGASAVRLLWCLVPLAAVVHYAVTVARSHPDPGARSALDAAGADSPSLPALAAVSTAVACLLGSALALLVHLHLRGDLTGLPFDGAANELVAADREMPVPAALTLLLVLPVAASAASAVALRPRPPQPGSAPGEPSRPSGTHPSHGLPWGAALIAFGLALEAFSGREAAQMPLPGAAEGLPAGIAAGWILVGLGLTLAGPALMHFAGRLLAAGRPGAARLLGGRALQEEAPRLGRPLGVLCAVAAGAVCAFHVYGSTEALGPLTVLGGLVVLVCTSAAVLGTAADARAARAPADLLLRRLGAPGSLRRGSVALRLTALAAVLGPLTWALAQLAALPLATA